MHSPAHRKKHTHLSGSDLGHFNPAEFIAACDYQSKFVNLCTDFDCLYGGGISVCGQWVFIDRDIPLWFYDDGSAYVPTNSDTDPSGNPCWWLPRFWIPHETFEFNHEMDAGRRRRDFVSMQYMLTRDRKWVIGTDEHYNYEPSHQIAEGTEERLAAALGLDLVKYVAMCDGLIEMAYAKDITSSPANLYLQPYEDPGAGGSGDDDSDDKGPPDMESLKKIADTGGPVSYLLLPVGVRGGHDGRPWWGA